MGKGGRSGVCKKIGGRVQRKNEYGSKETRGGKPKAKDENEH